MNFFYHVGLAEKVAPVLVIPPTLAAAKELYSMSGLRMDKPFRFALAHFVRFWLRLLL